MRTWRTSLTVAAIVNAVLLTAGTTVAGGVAAASGAVRASVPWGRVGAGWILAQYTTGLAGPGEPGGPEMLYLVSPGGTRYQLASWPDGRTAPSLVAWSPDGKRALFRDASGEGAFEQLTLATGQLSRFVLPSTVMPIGYTTPDGLNIVTYRPSGTSYMYSLARYSLSGRLTRSLGSSDGQALYAPSGIDFVTGTSTGLELVSNGGTLLRQLPVPGTSANSCGPVRWWDGGTVLASCGPSGGGGPRLWLVPVSGGRPTALTPPRSPRSGDYGDIDAWQLPSGLYLQTLGACGVLEVFKQAPNGSVTLVTVPHTEGDNHVLTALGSRLLIQAPTSCEGSISLLWFDPGTRAEQWVFRTPPTVAGVSVAIPFYSRENGDL